MKRKVVFLVALTMVCSAMLTGCEDEEVSTLKQIEALNEEAAVTDVGMSVNDKEAAVYAQVSNRTLLDLTLLEGVGSNDMQAISNYMDSVGAQLTGTIKSVDGVIDSCYTDYLLMLFERTPYYWQRTQMNVRGMDSASRSVVVDVTYKTIDFKKDVQQSSYIAKGCNSYDLRTKVRYDRWMEILDYKYGTLGWGGDYEDKDTITYDAEGVPTFIDKEGDSYKKYLDMYEEFISNYGDPEDIIESQRAQSLTDVVYETGNQRTYTGLVDSSEEEIGGTITIRYVLVPQYTLGINQGYVCKHMYLLDYALKTDPTEGRELYSEEGSSTIADSVYDVMYRYFTCLDEDNFTGLYGLCKDFEAQDKYYEDYFDTSYRKHENFTLSLFSVAGTKIECGVTVSEKERAKGSSMTLPMYTNRYYVTMELVDDSLKITNIVLLSSKLEGEPAIDTDAVETTGFNSSITLDNSDKKDIEELISNFGARQLEGDLTSDEFAKVVDMSISATQMSDLKDNVVKISGDKKAVWLISYLQGTSNYASVKCKEVVHGKDNALREATTIYDFIYKGGKWIITGYSVQSMVTLDSTDMSEKNALCVCIPGKVDKFTSQVSGGTESESSAVDLDTLGEVVTYEEKTPVLKSGTSNLEEVNASDVTDADLAEYLSDSSRLADFNRIMHTSCASGMDALTELKGMTNSALLLQKYKEMVAVQKNYQNGLVSRADAMDTASSLLLDVMNLVGSTNTSNDSTENPVEEE